jgi:drug/metabolite transporter (DMT)-like permease
VAHRGPVQNVGLGIALRIAAMFCMAGLSALVKWCSGRGVPVLEIVFFRNAFAFFSVLRTRRPGGHLARATVGLTGMVCGFTAVGLLPLTESTALSFSAPLFMTALSALILKEPVGRHRWGAVAVGFIGVLVMVNPDPAKMAGTGILFALAGAVAAAGAMTAIREISRTEPGPTIVFYFTLSGMALGLCSLPFGWVVPDRATLALLVCSGLIGGVGQLLLTEAVLRAPVAVIAPFDYTQLIWASLLGLLVWGETPRLSTYLGAAIVAGGSIYILLRETRRFRLAAN